MTDPQLAELEEQVGHPEQLLDAILQRVQDHALIRFADITEPWLDLMWCIDAYRVEGRAPSGMGNPDATEPRRLDAACKMKGNWFAVTIAALLQNRTHQELARHHRYPGYSQPHQVDVAWPARDADPLVCLLTKVTGGPAYGDTPSRSALPDFSNRRKEVKFAAADLKLFASGGNTSVPTWESWRAKAPPRMYLLWAARLKTEGATDSVETIAKDISDLTATYLEGASAVSWRSALDGTPRYENVSIAGIPTIDNVLTQIANDVRRLATNVHVVGDGETVPPPTPIAKQLELDAKRERRGAD